MIILLILKAIPINNNVRQKLQLSSRVRHSRVLLAYTTS